MEKIYKDSVIHWYEGRVEEKQELGGGCEMYFKVLVPCSIIERKCYDGSLEYHSVGNINTMRGICDDCAEFYDEDSVVRFGFQSKIAEQRFAELIANGTYRFVEEE